jgi:hypothetical protein
MARFDVNCSILFTELPILNVRPPPGGRFHGG